MNTTSLRNQTIPPNQALQTTTRTVTPAASHPSRQRVSCLIFDVRQKTMRALYLIALFVCIAASASELSKKVQVGMHRSLFWYLNVHASEDHWIKIAEKKYHHVLGYGSTFIEIEKLNAVFFITARGHDRYAHFVSVDGKIDCEIPFSGIADIGSSNGGVSVLIVAWPTVMIESRWSGFIDVFTFDLSKKIYLERREKEPNQSLETTSGLRPAASHL